MHQVAVVLALIHLYTKTKLVFALLTLYPFESYFFAPFLLGLVLLGPRPGHAGPGPRGPDDDEDDRPPITSPSTFKLIVALPLLHALPRP